MYPGNLDSCPGSDFGPYKNDAGSIFRFFASPAVGLFLLCLILNLPGDIFLWHHIRTMASIMVTILRPGLRQHSLDPVPKREKFTLAATVLSVQIPLFFLASLVIWTGEPDLVDPVFQSLWNDFVSEKKKKK